MKIFKSIILFLSLTTTASAQPFGGAFNPEAPSSAYQIFTAPSKFVGLLGASDITVQQALETLSYIKSSPTTILSDWDFGGGGIEIENGTVLPGSCTVGQIFMDTDETSGQRIFGCEGGSFVLQGDGGGGGGGDNVSINGTAATNININNSSPAVPASGLTVAWQIDTSPSPDNVSAYAVLNNSSTLAGALSDESGSGTVIFGTSPTITSPTISTSIGLPVDAVDAITEIASSIKTGADAKLVTGTAGGNGNCAQWNVDGDIVDSGAGCGGGSGDSILVNGTAVTDANFNESNPSTPASGLSVKWQTTGSSPSQITGYAAVNTSAILAGVISDETGTGVVVFGTSPTFTTSATITDTFEAKASAVSVINKAFYAGSVSTQITNGTNPSLNTAGQIAVDTSDIGQFVFASNTTVNRVIPGTLPRDLIVENLAAADDNMSLGSFPYPVTIDKIWCECEGTCTTTATLSFEDDSSNAMTLSGTPVCATGTTIPAEVNVTAGGSLNARESWQFDVTNALSPETDDYMISYSYSVNIQ